MKKLNLTNLEQSEIKYKIHHFPDGQQDIIILGEHIYREATRSDKERDEIIPLHKNDSIKIMSHFNSFKDLELIICAKKALKRLGIKEIHLYIPYLLGARSDRQFQEGGNSYLVDIIAPIINAQEFESVTVMDVHSDVAAACINNLKSITNWELVKWSLTQHINTSHLYKGDGYVLVSPDGGSLKKIYKVADSIGYKGEIITCSKSRNTEGKLTKIVVPLDNYIEKDIIIIDDICDGGATFISIAQIIKNIEGFNGKIYLIVTHGIFSTGFNELAKYFNGIYCTNSVKQDYFYNSFESNEQGITPSFLKVLNIF